MSNPYLQSLEGRYSAIQASVTDMQSRASAEKRDMSEDELRTVTGQVEAGKKLFAEIALLTEQESRTLSVNEMAAKLAVGAKSATTAVNRDPGHYRSVKEGGALHSFFGDMYRSQKQGDQAATRRLAEHTDALRAHQTYATEPGVLPPVWMTDEYTSIKQQGRVVSNVVRNVPLADARPFSLPGQTASTTTGLQGGENVALTAGDAYASAAVTVTPSTIVGSEIVSRQLLESSAPSIDALILADLVESYNTEIETIVVTAMKAVGSLLTGAALVHADFISPTGGTSGFSAYKTAVALQSAVYKARFLRPDYIAMDHDLFGTILGLVDSTGRPLLSVPQAFAQGQNVTGSAGIGGQVTDGWLAGVPIMVTEGMVIDGTHDGIMAFRSQDVCLFEKAGPSLFRFEEVQGPQSIVLSLWNYAAVAIRQGTRSVKNASVLNT